MEKIGANQPLLYLSNIGSNKISDKGCLHISEAHWPNIKEVHLSIHRNSSVNCVLLTLSDLTLISMVYHDGFRYDGLFNCIKAALIFAFVLEVEGLPIFCQFAYFLQYEGSVTSGHRCCEKVEISSSPIWFPSASNMYYLGLSQSPFPPCFAPPDG